MSNPDINIAGGYDNEISKNALMVNSFLICRLPDHVNFDYSFKVIGFYLSLSNTNNTNAHSDSNRLTKDMLDYIADLEKETYVNFTNIRIKGSNDWVFLLLHLLLK